MQALASAKQGILSRMSYNEKSDFRKQADADLVIFKTDWQHLEILLQG